MFIPRILVFDKLDGHCIINTGVILIGGKKIKNDEEIINTYADLKERSLDTIYIHRESYNSVTKTCEFDFQFNHGSIPTYNADTEEITWEYSEVDIEHIDEETRLKNDIAGLKQQMKLLGKVMVNQKIKGGDKT